MRNPSETGRVKAQYIEQEIGVMMRFGYPGMNSARTVLAIQAIAVVVGGLVALAGSAVAAIASALFVAAVLSVSRDGRTVAAYLSAAARYLLRRRGRSPLDARTLVTVEQRGLPTGVVWNGSELSVVAELGVTGIGGWTTVGGEGIVSDVSVPFRVLSDSVSRTKAPIVLGVTTVGSRPVRGRRASDAYSSMAGTLASVSHRRTWLSLSMDVHDGASGISRRGGGVSGGATVLTRHMSRLQHILGTLGIEATLLTADAIADADLFVSSGTPRRHVRTTWRAATLGGTAWTSRRLRPNLWTSSIVDDVFDRDASVTAMSVTTRADGDAVSVVGSYGQCAAVPVERDVTGSATLDGEQHRGFDAILPSTACIALPTSSVDPNALDPLVFPVAGCGQILGVDGHGSAVAMRVYGPAIRSIRVRAELYLVHQIVFRAVAIGATVVVVTDRHHAWRHLAASLADSGTLSVVAVESSQGHDADLMVADHPSVRPVPTGGTVLHVDTDRRSGDADIEIDQADSSGDHVVVTVGHRSIALRLVTTAAETEAIGRPRTTIRQRSLAPG
ncbi:type VII secretion protein EccE [Rhodococcus sp. MEB064]|uniref:type VII secretion protein EccE n=1 Tax=Rhodococcus sp. MEB064 TaxID=1587522 RepID=UPI0005ABBD9A|nr:type VII secretion protein EccE [Rhodococcus sp. MEB064]KIQ17147.1 hypothetical protein RU01_11395 [Rhodococcus sp. MEB064]